MHFGKLVAAFLDARPRMAPCTVPYKTLKRSAGSPAFADAFRDLCAWRARAAIAGYRLGAPCRSRAADLLCASRLNVTAVRKILKKHARRGGPAVAWPVGPGPAFSGHLPLDLAAVAGEPAPVCPVCLGEAREPVTRGCSHAACGRCLARLPACPVCRRAGPARRLEAWRSRGRR